MPDPYVLDRFRFAGGQPFSVGLLAGCWRLGRAELGNQTEPVASIDDTAATGIPHKPGKEKQDTQARYFLNSLISMNFKDTVLVSKYAV